MNNEEKFDSLAEKLLSELQSDENHISTFIASQFNGNENVEILFDLTSSNVNTIMRFALFLCNAFISHGSNIDKGFPDEFSQMDMAKKSIALAICHSIDFHLSPEERPFSALLKSMIGEEQIALCSMLLQNSLGNKE